MLNENDNQHWSIPVDFSLEQTNKIRDNFKFYIYSGKENINCRLYEMYLPWGIT